MRDSLNENKGEKIANGDLVDLIRRTRCFGINLAKIDIRQESSRHSKLVSEFLGKKFKYNLLNEDKKINLLISLIKKKITSRI